MNETDKFILLAELSNEDTVCCLNHGTKDNDDHIAVDFICIPMGYKQDNDIEIQTDELVIPICQECADGLLDSEWVLLYCYQCNSSQWIYKPLARRFYKKSEHLRLMDGCHKCIDEGEQK